MSALDLVIIGGGPAGLTAGIYGSRAGLSTLILEKSITGGQMRLTGEIENFPGFPLISGAEFSTKLHEQAFNDGAAIKVAGVSGVDLSGGRILVRTADETIEASSLIIATGTKNVNLDRPGAEEFVGRGVSFCALCDAGFMRGETVAVVGGGNSALEEADYLARFAEKVYLIHRRDEFRAVKAVQDKAASNPKIEMLLSSEVERIDGTDIVETVTVKNKKTGESKKYPVAGVFMFVGKVPQTEFLPPEIKTAKGGWIETNERLETNVSGVFAAGDVRDTDLRQVITAAADGARAAVNAYHYLQNPK
ncbi:MAG: thioredoxin-disulfide reductase [Deltaproteobacteria bacterium]|jgi:thioredoxin reductase (NADPH)|nr:thioredoxin-disulfide reductase [Deltaproteobacteria bacterium]